MTKKASGVDKRKEKTMVSRGSLYRGVSANCRGWQIILMVETRKVYLCCCSDQETAARIYDLVIIQTKGMGKVNFNYTKAELFAILFEPNILLMKAQSS